MSQPIRYGLSDEHLGRIHPAKDGHLVMWADYAALAAELERMRSEHEVGFSSVVLKKWAAEHAALAAENERLRKAGDEVALHYAERIEIEAGETAKTLMRTLPVLKAWLAAKEGRDAK